MGWLAVTSSCPMNGSTNLRERERERERESETTIDGIYELL
jgi:hypothetical protein